MLYFLLLELFIDLHNNMSVLKGADCYPDQVSSPPVSVLHFCAFVCVHVWMHACVCALSLMVHSPHGILIDDE